jgi:hypothetical protein
MAVTVSGALLPLVSDYTVYGASKAWAGQKYAKIMNLRQ